ncbi:C40 family peptidase [Aromatoleum anaerobium]|uniref:NlpC/P60 domain-containing protein n=1 Tax=Aromatoleum anaerobium TaxID=182180 RepID=A0ABX1PRH8_9RHOO|nr:C40 family peptidase [Aromatoleum anaerobium]MCK0507844.1 C40 family peptidase [Aromatoleum anaerobium]
MPTRLPAPVGLAAIAIAAALLAACSGLPTATPSAPVSGREDGSYFSLDDPLHSQEMVIFALGLLDTGYRFGGRNPEAGLDCSGMVSYIVEQISGRRLPHNAAQIAQLTRPIPIPSLQAGDLVFFNTRNQRHSHMGIYLGDGRFVHAPSSRGRIRIELLENPYFKSRIDGARSLLAAN